jgi:CPA1 family monovalent cation:H+ antiporter
LVPLLCDREPRDEAGMLEVRIEGEQAAIEFLRGKVNDPDYPSELVARQLISHERMLGMLDPSQQFYPTPIAGGFASRVEAIQRRAFSIEQEVIQDYYSDGRLSRAQAKDLRDNVTLMLIDLEDHI